jgi:hypothetical protein
MSSYGSSASGMSVSAFGATDVGFDDAVDTIFKGIQDSTDGMEKAAISIGVNEPAIVKDIQERINLSHCATREIGMKEDRNDTFMEAAEIYYNLVEYCEQLGELFKELSSCAKQALGKCPVDLKVEFKAYTDKRKLERSEDKLRIKNEAKAEVQKLAGVKE